MPETFAQPDLSRDLVAALRARPGLIGAAWLFLAVNVANLLAYLYQVAMLRLLPPAEFSILVALFAALIIEAQGIQLIQQAAAKIVADRRAVGDEPAIAAFVRSWGLRIALVVAIPSILLALATPLASPALGFPAPTVAMLGASLLFASLFAFGAGVLQGLGRFVWLGGLLIAQAGARLVLGVLLVLAGLGVVGAFGAAAAAIALSFVAAAVPLRSLLFRPARADAPAVGRFFFGAAAVFFSYAALVNVDALLAPVLLPRVDAGAYAAAVTMGKIALFAPLGLSFFLLERTASAYAVGAPTRPTFYLILITVVAVSGAVAAVYLLLPELATRIVAGEAYLASVSVLIGTYGIVAFSNAVLNVWIAYFVGVGRLRVGALYALAVVALAVALAAGTREPLAMARTVLVATLAMQVVSAVVFLRIPR